MVRVTTRTERRDKRDPATKLAEHRLSVLDLARELGNVAEACRRRGLDRTSFYEWKRRFQTQGFEGLKDLPPIHKSHPQTTPPEDGGQDQGAGARPPGLWLQPDRGDAVAGGHAGLGDHHPEVPQRPRPGHQVRPLAGAGERANADKAFEISAEQVAFLEKLNPCFQGAPCRKLNPRRIALRRHLLRRQPQGHRQGLPACHGRRLRLLRLWLPCTSPSSPRRRWRCCTTTCCRSTAGSTCR